MRWRKRAFRGAAFCAAVAIVLGLGGTSSAPEGPWPDSGVAELWRTFASVPAPETGGGGLSNWDGSFRGCIPSPRVAFDFACEYADEQGRVGYVCVSPSAVGAPIAQWMIDARVAPDDPTYGGEEPTKVCYSALAYRLSLG
jgi:hypothetical protein